MAVKEVQEAVRKPASSSSVRSVTTARETSASGSKKSETQTHDADLYQVRAKALIMT